ncbi:MAG: hypothetical protein Q4C53_03545 [Clostridia bacterium]|nr:hypothetical protein [Clostridia bacterium]
MNPDTLFLRFGSDVRRDGGQFFAAVTEPRFTGDRLALLTETLDAVRNRCREAGESFFIHFTEQDNGEMHFASIRFSAHSRIEADLPALEAHAAQTDTYFRFAYSPGCARINIAG